jgi:hypothetical protein
MSEDDNLILRLLREYRAEREDQAKRLIRVERRVDELHEIATAALGMSAHSNVVAKTHGERFDGIEDRLAALPRRVAELESKA